LDTTDMRLIFCSDPFDRKQPDSAYAAEAEAATGQGLPYSLLNYEALVDEGNPDKAIRAIHPAEEPEVAVYRGWMLKPETYRQLYDTLSKRNIRLVNDPEAYRHCHYLPESYPVIASYTPKTVWMSMESQLAMADIMSHLQEFGEAPVIVKDYVKSRKHEWAEACFIPSAADAQAVERVVRRFMELQGDDLEGALVFREYVELEPLGTHSKSGMPLTKEFRIFFLHGRPIYTVQYWEEGKYGSIVPPVGQFTEVAAQVQSNFFTMDIAKRKVGGWIIVELGDAQVAGLPDNADLAQYYSSLASGLRSGGAKRKRPEAPDTISSLRGAAGSLEEPKNWKEMR
jgi:hypothetical protein